MALYLERLEVSRECFLQACVVIQNHAHGTHISMQACGCIQDVDDYTGYDIQPKKFGIC